MENNKTTPQVDRHLMNTSTFVIMAAVALLLIAIIYGLSRCSCDNHNEYPNEEKSSSIVIDTVYIHKVDTFYKDRPIYRTQLDTVASKEVINKLLAIIRELPDAELMAGNWNRLADDGLVDTMAILQDYLTAYENIDTVRVEAGKIIIRDTIAANVITGRSVVTDINQPYVISREKTVEQRAVLYAGLIGQGYTQKLDVSGGISLDLKTKRKAMYQLAGLMSTNGPIIQVGYKRPLSLK